GGPPGFLKVLDERTIGYADFRGNVQYISVGNLQADDRIALILMDYPNRRRLKIWARAKVTDEADDPALIARLEMPSYRARVERAIVLAVEAYDWNCPQHITPRYTEAEVGEQLLAPLERKLARLEQENQRLKFRSVGAPSEKNSGDILGDGPVELVVSGIRQLTPTVRAYELRAPDGAPLPEWTPGAHLAMPVALDDGRTASRHYSLSGDPARADHYLIAVRRDDQGRGGSAALHRTFALGTRLRCALPNNRFPLHEDKRPALLIAGGIGITPLRAMALALQRDGREFALHAIAPTPAELPFRSELAAELGPAVHFWSTRAPGQPTPDLDRLLQDLNPDTVIYVCGPTRLLEGVLAAARRQDIDPTRIRFERFGAPPPEAGDHPMTVELRRSGQTLQVRADQSILDAALAAGIHALYDCKAGVCGTCAVKLLAGEPEHRDTVLSAAERDRAGLLCTCVSRARGDLLVLDL
ncbi:MAG: 2Fe-2S iron-sulfur cluster binding domain-containing protein, partial [Gammaproteobacteria bacterium]|nr:2Fe-2S iron-sulfur cluster binding domain-containing protein [Gammaproteobacteria bacterium]